MSNSITSQTPLPSPLPPSGELGPLVGRTFGGYEITGYIGEGPTGAVYRAEGPDAARMVVKVMHRELSRKETAERLRRDLERLGGLENANLLQVHKSGFGDDGELFIVMDELTGCDLESGLQATGALAPKKALELLLQVCTALEAAHDAGVVHGGLKPSNIFLLPSTPGNVTVKLLDFGAARLAGGVDKGVIVGNPLYMAPEQFGGVAEPRTDIYALGVLMYELFSGTLPFAGPSHGQVMMRHLAEVPASPPGVDAELAHIILRSLTKTPAGRYPSVRHLREALARWAETSPALLSDAATHQVVARAVEARAVKQSALAAPDATSPMAKIDAAELARTAPQEMSGAKRAAPPEGTPGSNSSESVEASLEDFISQANASFPQSNDGWDLHTGDVELVDDEDGNVSVKNRVAEAVAKPAAAPAVPKKVSKPMPAVADAPVGDAAKRVSKPMPAVPPLPDPADTTNESVFKAESTDLVSGPLARVSSATTNPLVWVAALLAAFLVGAGVVYFMVRSMIQPPQIIVQPPAAPVAPAAPAAAAAPAPVVTPLPPAPVVTPLPAAAAPEAEPAVEKPAAAKPAAPKAAAAKPAPKPAPKPAAAKPAVAKPAAAAAKPAAAKPAAAKPAATEKPAAAEKPAAPAKKEAAPKGDWVDPFAQ